MADFTNVDSGRTLSIFQEPGEFKRTPNANTPSIFTFGDYKFQESDSTTPTGETQDIKFNSFSTLEKMNFQDWDAPTSTFVTNKELKLQKNNPLSYSYFSSFYSYVADSINKITKNFPYGILSYDSLNSGVGNSIVNYSNSISGTASISSFRVPVSAVTNQGALLLNSGRTDEDSLAKSFSKYVVQKSGDTKQYNIIDYKFIPATASTSYLDIKVNGNLFTSSTLSEFQDPIYIKPNKVKLNNYYNSLSRLEKQILLNKGNFLIPKIENPNINENRKFIWPKSIDGLNPDNHGSNFDNYLDEILIAAERVDESKTDIMARTMIPENFLDNDSENIYQGLISTYARQFDEIKQFIDNIAYAHTINYGDSESVPNKFMSKLGNLLGLELPSSFNELDLFEYLVGDVDEDSSLESYNIEIWKKLLINITWLYKKKGTRDALQFIFKLIGAPECLVNFNEFVYEIERNEVVDSDPNSFDPQDFRLEKINNNGYINYNATQFEFQEGGAGRGNGQAYINQWRPEFDPTIKVDNIKIQTGDSKYFGTENIVNTKEVSVNISPSNAIECDVFDYYKEFDLCWVWGTTGSSYAFQLLTVPFEDIPENCDAIDTSKITGMSLSQWTDYVYATSVDPRNRKTLDQSHTSFHYPELKKIYLLYYLSSNPPSNKLNFYKLEAFINLLEVQFESYLYQFIPATTIFQNSNSVIYKNTVFNRQKFVYKEGINKGSEFKRQAPANLGTDNTAVKMSGSILTGMSPKMEPVVIRGSIIGGASASLNMNNIKPKIVSGFKNRLNAFALTSEIEGQEVSLVQSEPFYFNTN